MQNALASSLYLSLLMWNPEYNWSSCFMHPEAFIDRNNALATALPCSPWSCAADIVREMETGRSHTSSLVILCRDYYLVRREASRPWWEARCVSAGSLADEPRRIVFPSASCEQPD